MNILRMLRDEARVLKMRQSRGSIPTPSIDPQPGGEDSMQLTELMVLCTKLQTHVLDLQKAKDAQAKEIAALKKRIQKLERRKMSRPTGLKRFRKVADVTLVNEQQNEDLMFDTGVLDDDEVFVDVISSEKNEQSTKIDDSTAGEDITTASIDDTMIEADSLLAERLQSKEREELTDKEKAKLFMELMEKRRKHFAQDSKAKKRRKKVERKQLEVAERRCLEEKSRKQ
ncbi:hypothetical protein Tco_0355119 [Tanacetum coccineum]